MAEIRHFFILVKDGVQYKYMYKKKIFLLLTTTFAAIFLSLQVYAASFRSLTPWGKPLDSLYASAIGEFRGNTLVLHGVDASTPSPQSQARIPLTQDDFSYVGAFRLPKDGDSASRFGYGGGALAFNPHGDPTGNDGYPGSLYILGHEHDQLVAEVNIPVPVDQRSRSLLNLNSAAFLHGFVDITGGLARQFDEGNGYRVDGLAYLDAQGTQTTSKIYWTARTYYNVDGSSDPSHGMSEADLSHVNAKGVWRLGDYSGMMTGGYIFPVPAYFADSYLGGKRLIAGLFTAQGVSHTSQGPALFAYGPWQNNNLVNGVKLDTTALVYYPYTTNFNPEGDPIGNFPDHQVPDQWNAAAWVDSPEKHAVVVVGRRSMGKTYYGDARPGDCTIDKGYHGEPYEPRILFYDPADLSLAAQNKKDPTTIVPYLEWNPSKFFVKDCNYEITGVTYDEASQLLYILHTNADREGGEPTPLLYVFKIKS